MTAVASRPVGRIGRLFQGAREYAAAQRAKKCHQEPAAAKPGLPPPSYEPGYNMGDPLKCLIDEKVDIEALLAMPARSESGTTLRGQVPEAVADVVARIRGTTADQLNVARPQGQVNKPKPRLLVRIIAWVINLFVRK